MFVMKYFKFILIIVEWVCDWFIYLDVVKNVKCMESLFEVNYIKFFGKN